MSGQDPLGVTISAREIYDQIVGLRDDVRSLTQSNVHVDATLADHETRLRSIERWKYGVLAALVSGLITTATTILGKTGVI